VQPFELMKLRLLNGSHSTLAYLGYLAGHETVADVMGEPGIAAVVKALMDREVTPTLPRLPGFDLDAYKASLLARFRNPALRHRTWQIAMDGSQKLPQRLLGTARDRLREGAAIDGIALGVAAWMRYVTGSDEAGRPIDVRDPLIADLRTRTAAAAGDPDRLGDELMSLTAVFGHDLPREPRFTEPVRAALSQLFREGAAATASRAGHL
jgi:fructuronate reductase